MSYALGVDLGTTYTAAVIGRGATAEPLQLGADTAQVASVVYVREDGETLVGDAAERRAVTEPIRVAREFKRRLGDTVPIVLGTATHSVESLMGILLRDTVRRATEQLGEAPSLVVLTHPANYSQFKRDVLLRAAGLAGLDPATVQLLTEPEAAAVAYSRQQRIEPGEVVAIYDFGGGTFDAALVRNAGSRFELIGVPEGMERLGGIDFDQAVLGHVDRSLDGLVSSADRSDPNVVPAQHRLRQECKRAKEVLSSDSDATIRVDLPGVQTEVRLTRAEFEQMIRPRVAETIVALQRAVASAGLTMEQVSRILLVGGSSRLPMVAEMVRSTTGRPVTIDAHPKLAIATGAALVGGAALGATATVAATPQPPAPAAPTTGRAAPTPPPLGPPASPATSPTDSWQPPVRVAPMEPAGAPTKKKRTALIVAAAAVIGAGAVGVVFALKGGSDTSTAPTTVAATSTPPTAAVTTLPATSVASTSPATSIVPVGGVVHHVAFGGAPGTGVPGPAATAGVDAIRGIAADGATIYIAGGHGVVYKVAGGNASVVASLDPAGGEIGGITVAAGVPYVTNGAGVWALGSATPQLVLDRTAAGLGTTAGALTHDGAGSLYIADNDHHRVIRRGSDSSLSLVAGNGSAPAGAAGTAVADDGQQATAAALGMVSALLVDDAGHLLIADATVRQVRSVGADGVITTPYKSTTFGSLNGLAGGSAGSVIISSDQDGTVVQIDKNGTATTLVQRRAGTPSTDDVPVGQTSVGVLGAVAPSPDGVLFVDGTTIRIIAAR